MAGVTNVCVFRFETGCTLQDKYAPARLTELRKSSAESASEQRADGLKLFLVNATDDDTYYHTNCYLTYVSKDHIKRKKRKSEDAASASHSEDKKRKTRSSIPKFNFKEDCFVCGEKCNVVPDKKHPDRWKKNPGYKCKTVERGKGVPTFKETVLNLCAERGDEAAMQVQIRVEGATTDLHAAEARYHLNCWKNFQNPKHVAEAQKDNALKSPEEYARRYVVRSCRNQPESVWTSVQLHELYLEKGGREKNRRRFMDILNDLMNDIYIFTSPGRVSNVMMKEKASSIFNMTSVESEDEDIDSNVSAVAKQIKRELNQRKFDSKNYSTLNSDNLFEECSTTLINLLTTISDKFNGSLSSAMIGSIVTAEFTGHHTRLQLSMAVLAHSKTIIEQMNEYGVTSSYKELRRFKISAADAAEKKLIKSKLDASNGFIQIVSDNFDAKVHSQNGMKDTHGLATIATQSFTSRSDQPSLPNLFPRLSDEEMAKVKFEEDKVQFYSGPKEPSPPKDFFQFNPLPLKVLCQQVMIVNVSKNTDFDFLKESATSDDVPDYHGYNTHLKRISGLSSKRKTEVEFQPLMDRTPADRSTILTAMINAEKITNEAGQSVTVFTADQQLYRIAIDITWSDPDRWINFIPRIGGMHWLMSFVGCIGVLMANSGLSSVLKAAFGSVDKMLLGKKYPMNVRALRFVVIELLRGNIDAISNYDELIQWLDDLCTQSVLSEHWVKNLVKPVLLILLYVRAEREGEFSLHLYSCNKMMPYFLAARHVNFLRYGLCYLRSMEKIPGIVLENFMKGHHVMRHQDGIFNAIWSDNMIESTYMKFGKGPLGIIGSTTKPRTLQIWAKSQHACTHVLNELSNLGSKEKPDIIKHKEESKARMKADAIDRQKLRTFLSSCVQPLNPLSHDPTTLCNIYTGEYGGEDCNVNKAVEIGKSQLKTFQQTLPDGFGDTISSLVVTMKKGGKREKKKEIVEIYNTELIFARVAYLLSCGKIQINNLFDYELSPIPESLFKPDGDPRYPKNKSDLKNDLKVEVSSRIVQPDVLFIDGCAMLYSAIYWPKGGKVSDLLHSIRNYIGKYLNDIDVYLVFDRYREKSIKSDTRLERLGQLNRTHNLMIGSPLPSKDLVLKITKTKVQLISLIADYLLDNFIESQNKLVITSAEDSPEQIHNGVREVRTDMKTSHEEADVIIPQQVMFATKEGYTTAKVIAEDTDIFVLLCHFYFEQQWTIKLFMESFGTEKSIICIRSSVERNKSLIPSLLSAHAFGCDTVPSLVGIGKKTVISAIKTQPLLLFGESDTSEEDFIYEAKMFVAACYGLENESSSENRKTIWERRTSSAKLTAKPIALKSLPPTDPVLELNIHRARQTRLVWGASLQPDPPTSDSLKKGWYEDPITKTLRPTMIPKDLKVAPDEILKITRCNCNASHCRTTACSCASAGLPCSKFCGCHENGCENKWNKVEPNENNDNDDNDNDEANEDEGEGTDNED